MTASFRQSRAALGLYTFVFVLVGFPLAETQLHAEAQSESLDEQLFDGLDDDLFSDLKPIEEIEKQEPINDLDRQLRRELGGEELGRLRGANRLQQLSGAMQQVRDRLQGRDFAAETQQMQRRIVSSLDDVIAKLKKQPPSNSGGKPKPQGAKPKTGKQPKPSNAKPGNNSSNLPAKDSTTRLGNAETAATDTATQDQLMQESWGNLPAAVRQQMQSARPEEFLPKYSRLIEEYYKRLSQEKRK